VIPNIHFIFHEERFWKLHRTLRFEENRKLKAFGSKSSQSLNSSGIQTGYSLEVEELQGTRPSTTALGFKSRKSSPVVNASRGCKNNDFEESKAFPSSSRHLSELRIMSIESLSSEFKFQPDSQRCNW
jgi:hypothetical protein